MRAEVHVITECRCLFEENPAAAANRERSLPIFQSASYIKPVRIQYCGKPTAAAVLDTSYLVVHATRRCDACATLEGGDGACQLVTSCYTGNILSYEDQNGRYTSLIIS